MPTAYTGVIRIRLLGIDRTFTAPTGTEADRVTPIQVFQDLTGCSTILIITYACAPSERDGEREVYIGFSDFNCVVANLPAWVQPIVRTLYFTGMRRGEALGLNWSNVDLESRIITLYADQIKEHKKKRVPIHRVLVPILQKVGKLRAINNSRVFLTEKRKPPSEDSLRKPWKLALEAAGLDTAFTLHDLRHVWSTNAMRSGMDPRIAETIMGHALRQEDVPGRYLSFSDDDLLRAINSMRFDNGKTEIWLARHQKKTRQLPLSGIMRAKPLCSKNKASAKMAKDFD